MKFVLLYALSHLGFRISLMMPRLFYHQFPTPFLFQNGLCSEGQFMKKNGKLQHIPQARTDCKFEFFFSKLNQYLTTN